MALSYLREIKGNSVVSVMDEGNVRLGEPENDKNGISVDEKAEEEVDGKTQNVTEEKEVKHATDDMQVDREDGKNDKDNETEAHIEHENVVEDDTVNKVEKLEDVTMAEEICANNGKKNDDEEALEDQDDKENSEKPSKGKGSKKRLRKSISTASKQFPHAQDSGEEEENANEQLTPLEKKNNALNISSDKEGSLTPAATSFNRPVRERKSVERLVALVGKNSGKDFHVEKGRGTALKNIPNVAYKLSRKKTEDTFRLLHTIIFGRRAKSAQVKSNMSMFSGFVWLDDEDKQIAKVKEKLDKCVKEKLVEFCDVLDIQISKAQTRKEDIITKLVDFLLKPHATTSELHAKKEQSSEGKKRKRVSKPSAESTTPSKSSSKSQEKVKSSSKKDEQDKSMQSSSDDNSREKDEEENVDGVLGKSEHDTPEQAETKERKNESHEDYEKKRKKKSPVVKVSSKNKSIEKEALKKKTSAKSKKSLETTPKTSSSKKKDTAIKKSSTPIKRDTYESTGKKVLKAKDRIEEKLKPSDVELNKAICEILKEVDFNTATFTDILKVLVKRFDTDLTSRKVGIKTMIQDELMKLADADEEEDDTEKKDMKA